MVQMQQVMVEVEVQCRTQVSPTCAKVMTITVPEEGLRAREAGALIQDAFPDLEPQVREMLVSRTCPQCWSYLFSFDD